MSLTTRRWRFEDLVAGESWTHPINPNAAESPFAAKSITTASGTNTTSTRMFQGPSLPQEWEFGGVIRSKEHHDELLRWAEKSDAIRVSDHLGRTFEVIIRAFLPVERRPTPNVPWRMTYTMRVSVLRRIA